MLPGKRRPHFRRHAACGARRAEQHMFARTLIQLQAELPALSSNSLHYTLEGAMHEIVPAGRGHALVVVDVVPTR